MSITKMFFARVIAPVLSSVVRKPKVTFPKKIGEYTYRKRFYPYAHNEYAYAIYEDFTGKRTIAKLWNRYVKNLAYYTLKNEQEILKTLNRILGRLGDSIPDEYSNIHIPSLIGEVGTKNSLIILKEFVKGDHVTLLNAAKKFNIYLKSNDFLQYLGENLTDEEKKNVSHRSALGIAALYPFLLMKALFTNPRASWNLIRGIPLFLKSVPIFLTRKSQFLGDRDLVRNNILVSGRQVYLIDLAYGMFSDPLYDAIYRLCLQWDEEDFRLLLLGHVKSLSRQHGENTETLIRGLMVHAATHALTANDLPKQVANRYFRILKFSKERKF